MHGLLYLGELMRLDPGPGNKDQKKPKGPNRLRRKGRRRSPTTPSPFQRRICSFSRKASKIKAEIITKFHHFLKECYRNFP
jgi:hypothetical protein